MQTDNPAGRLLYILQNGKKKPIHTPCKKVWAELLNVNENNLALLMSRLGKVTAVPGQISLYPSSEAISMKNLHSDEILKPLPDAGCRLTGNCWKSHGTS